MEKIEQLIKCALDNNNKLNFSQIANLNLGGEDVDYLLKRLDENKINISHESIQEIIKSKEKQMNKYTGCIVNSIEQYFKEINQIEILDVCEEKILFYFYKKNRTYDLRNALSLFYLRLVVSIASEYVKKIKNTSYQLLDVIQEGNRGLIRAIEKYDVMMGVRFSIYATWWIRRCIDLGLAENSKSIRMPLHLIEDYNKIMKFTTKCEKEGKKEVTNLDIAQATGLKESRIIYVLDIVGRTVVSYDEHIRNSDKITKLGFLSSDASTLEELTIEMFEHELINKIMRNVLNEREFFVVSYKTGFINETNKIPGEKSLEAVGKVLGVTRERVRQILKKAYEKIKDEYEKEMNGIELIKNNKK